MNFYNPMNQNFIGGYNNFQNFNEPRKMMPKLKNLLPDDKVKEMLQSGQGTGMKLEVRQKDIERHMCTHKNNGQIALKVNQNDKLQCPICGEEFEMVEADIETIQSVVNNMFDIIETIKTIGVDVPASFLTELAKMEAVMELIPALHQVSLKKWYTEYDNSGYTNRGVGNNASQLVDFVLNGGNMGGYNPYNPYMQQNQMGYANPYQAQQGYGYTQPQQQPYGYGQQQMVGGYYQQPNPQMNPYQGMGNQMPGQGMNVQYPNPTGQFENPFIQSAAPIENNQQKVAYGQPPQVDINQPVAQAKPEAAPAYQGPGASAKEAEAVSTKKMNV